FGDYLREAARTLKRDRLLHIYEATTCFGSSSSEVAAHRAAFAQALRDFGFDVVEVRDAWKFTYIKAMRNGRAPLADATIAFKQGASETPRRVSSQHPARPVRRGTSVGHLGPTGLSGHDC